MARTTSGVPLFGEEMDHADTIGQIAYEEFCRMPLAGTDVPWSKLDDADRDAWEAAALAARR